MWYKLRVADGHWGYVTSDSIAKYTGTIPNMWLEFNYQPTQVHLNYEARKKNPDIVINAGVNYITAPEGSTSGNTTPVNNTPTDTNTKDEVDKVEEVIEKVENNELNIKLMMQIISLLQQLLKLKMSM